MILHHLLMGIDIRWEHDDVLPAIALNGIEHSRDCKAPVQYHSFDFNVEAVQEYGDFLERLTVRHAAVIGEVGYRLAGGRVHCIHIPDHGLGFVMRFRESELGKLALSGLAVIVGAVYRKPYLFQSGRNKPLNPPDAERMVLVL